MAEDWVMSISISTDLVFDVVKASTPQKVRMAQLKLSSSNLGTDLAAKFQDLIGARSLASTKVRDLPIDLVADVVKSADHNKLSAATEKLGRVDRQTALQTNTTERFSGLAPNAMGASKENQQFEAMILRSFVEEIMPKATPSLYGEGTAGEVWRSMQADYMSQEIAKSGGVGIAKLLDPKDNAKVADGSVGNMNRIVPNLNHQQSNIAATNEWPYFQMGSLSGQQL
jgi:peptidoglycan hydrolase FlgJ